MLCGTEDVRQSGQDGSNAVRNIEKNGADSSQTGKICRYISKCHGKNEVSDMQKGVSHGLWQEGKRIFPEN